jgi:lipopolysaccharide transport system ATP-binding protein
MEGLRNAGRTVLFVSHNVGAVESLCSRAIWLQGGQVKLDGPAREVTQKYMSSNLDVVGGSVTFQDTGSRPGKGEVRLTRIELLNGEGRIQNSMQAGDSLSIRFHYRVTRPQSDISIGYEINSEFGMLVTESSTRLHNIELSGVATGDACIEVHIPELNLMPGIYYLSAGVISIGGPIQDTVDNCLRMEMLPGKVYGCARAVDNTNGVAFFPQTWNLEGVRRQP